MPVKAELRRNARRARRSLDARTRVDHSLAIADSVFAAAWFRRARSIGLYLASDEEVDTWSIIDRCWRMQKRVFVPVIGRGASMRFTELKRDSRLAENRYGLKEPTEGYSKKPAQLDAVLTPLVAFDADGHRIGMGGGYFDRAFAFLRYRQFLQRPKLIGLAFSIQEVPKISPDPWDVPLFEVYTERGPALRRARDMQENP